MMEETKGREVECIQDMAQYLIDDGPFTEKQLRGVCRDIITLCKRLNAAKKKAKNERPS